MAACSHGTPADAPASPSVTVRYVETAAPPVIEVSAAGRLALNSAELVRRDGQVIAAAAIEREAAPSPGFALPPTVGVGVFGGSSGGIGTGIGLGFPLGGGAPPPPPTRARARIPVDDVETYRRDWGELVVRLRFGTPPGETATAEIPAPAPR